MIPRERVLAAIRHQQPDRVPMDFGGTLMSVCTSGFLAEARRVLGFALPPDRDADGEWVDEAIQRYLDVDLRYVPGGPPLAILKDLDPAGYERALAAKKARPAPQAGILTTAVVREHPYAGMTTEELKALPPELPPPPRHLDWVIATAKEYRRNGYATTCWASSGFFEIGCWRRGYDQFAMDLLADQDFVRALFDRLLAERLHTIETTVKPLAPYIDAERCSRSQHSGVVWPNVRDQRRGLMVPPPI